MKGLLAIARVLLGKPGCTLGIAALLLVGACTRTDERTTPAAGTTQHAGQDKNPSQQVLPRAGMPTAVDKRPLWIELTPAQRQALAPLAAEWDGLDAVRKKKWLEVAAKYAQMSPVEQQRMQTRMREWAQLTPEQRRIARESYARAKKLDADQKSAKWELYQSLPDEEKQKLAADAEKKKNVVNLPRAIDSRNKPVPAKPALPVLPSAPAEVANIPLTATSTTPPTTVPAPPAGGPPETPGDPLSYSPK